MYIVTSPASGMPAAPTLAAVAVILKQKQNILFVYYYLSLYSMYCMCLQLKQNFKNEARLTIVSQLEL